MSNHSEFKLATILAISLLLALVFFHFNDELLYGSKDGLVITTDETEQDDLADDLMESEEY